MFFGIVLLSVLFNIEYLYLCVVLNTDPPHPCRLAPFSPLSLLATVIDYFIGPSPRLIVFTDAIAIPYCRFWVYPFSLAFPLEYSLSIIPAPCSLYRRPPLLCLLPFVLLFSLLLRTLSTPL